MGAKKVSRKIFDYGLSRCTAKSPFFYAISFVATFILIVAKLIFFSNYSLHPFDLITSHEIVEAQNYPQTDAPPIESLPNEISDIQENVEDGDEEYHDPLIPPENMSSKERTTWFRNQLPEVDIVRSSSISRQFHSRVMEFLNKGCSLLFHITWLSPAQSFGKREFMTMDTLFKAHPHGCLLIISGSMDSELGNRILKPLIDHGFKVIAITPDLPFLVKDTPAEQWLNEINSGNKDLGRIPLSQNLSNLIRLAILYKYGGIYMDADLIVIKDFSELRNAIGAQSVDPVTKQWTRLNGAIMIFDINHPILLEFLQEFASNFDGNKWGHNGPYLVTRVIRKVESIKGYNYNLTILPPKAFYPVDWHRIGRLFKKPENESESRWAESKLNEMCEGETCAVHLWNKQSRELDIEEGSVMAKLISDHCVVCDSLTKP